MNIWKKNMKNEKKKKPKRKHFYPALTRFEEFYSNFKLTQWNGCCILKGKLLSTLSRLVSPGNLSAKSTFLWKQKSDFFLEFYWTLTNRAFIIWTNNDETCVQGLQSKSARKPRNTVQFKTDTVRSFKDI